MSDQLTAPASGCQASCEAPTPDGIFLCKAHTEELALALRGVPSLAEDLEVTVTRQSRTGGQNHGSRSAERPLVWNERASIARTELTASLAAWAYETSCLDHDERDPLDFVDAGDTAELGRWLARNVLYARRLDTAGDLYAEVLDHILTATRTVDLPPEKKFVGVCNEPDEETGVICREDLYAMAKQRWATCKNCGASHDADTRREQMLGRIEDQAATTGVLAGLLTGLNVSIGSSTIRKYAADGRLKVISKDKHNRPQYLIGDVLDLFLKREKRADGPTAA